MSIGGRSSIGQCLCKSSEAINQSGQAMKQENNKENDLQDELESLYQKVARNDHNDEALGETEDISQCYAILQVSQDASQAEIAESYEKLKDTWREDRFINVDAWQEKSRKKLQ
jgi:DnaJ-class molecular chaperone